jgi:small subunit ribosomal protein S7
MRGKKAKKKLIPPDPVYQSRLVMRLINCVMKDGKKSIAMNQTYKAMSLIEEKTKKPALEILRLALENIKPNMEVRSRRIGGAAYQVPIPVKGDRRESLAIRWLLLAAKARPNKEYHHFYEKMAAEILDALKNEGAAIKKKETVHKMAEANKAFAHFRW